MTAAKQELAFIGSVEKAMAMIATASLDELLQIHGQAEAAKVYARKHVELQDAAFQLSVVSVRAARRAGEILAELKPRDGRPPKRSQGVTVSLSDVGVTKNQSSQWQRIAAIPEKRFEKYVAESVERKQICTASAALKLAKSLKTSERKKSVATSSKGCTVGDLHKLADSGAKFTTFYADPAWQYGNQATRASTDNHYDTMTVEEICEMPIARLAEERALLWLWTTNGFVIEALTRVIPAWGFEYKSMIIWCKPQMGIGNYVRVSHELLLIASRGGLRPDGKSQMSWVKCDREKHSSKPNVFRDIVERISPGKDETERIELFAREHRPGWYAWGNGIDEQKFLEAVKKDG